jgi:8-oxo-dGTP pyrophosphatase MutT (NUDIX family)
MEYSDMMAVGVWFYSLDTDRYLYLLRNDKKYSNTWGLPGGKVELGETLLAAIERECSEELGSMPDTVKLVPLTQFTSPDEQFVYHTFFCCVTAEFQPVLNDEHLGYAWIDAGTWPKPMHPGLWNTVNFDSVQEKIESVKNSVAGF